MIPNIFDYHKANSVKEALELMQKAGEDAKILAGGHSLLPSMKLRLSRPSALVDISGMQSLKYIREEGNHILIGAGTTHHEIANSSIIQQKLPLMAQAGSLIGDVQVRNWGTIAGSLAHADPAADWPASLLATEAEIVLESLQGKRTIKAQDFFTGIFSTALQANEIITEIRIPAPATNSKTAYVKFMQPASRFAIVGCAVVLNVNNGNCEKARVAFTGVAENAFRDLNVENALTGKTVDEANIKAAADQAAEGKMILSDHFASREYRKHLAKVYTRRALKMAIS